MQKYAPGQKPPIEGPGDTSRKPIGVPLPKPAPLPTEQDIPDYMKPNKS